MKEKMFNTLLVLLFLFGIDVSAQEKIKISLDAGYTYSVLHENLSGFVDSKNTGGYGLGVNFSGEYMVWKTLFVSIGVYFQQKNYKFERAGTREGWYSAYTNNFVGLPLLVGAYVFNNPHKNEGIWAKIAGGMYSEYWLSRKLDGQYPIFANLQPDGSNPYEKVSENYDFKKNENNLNRWGYGLQGQAQIGYSFKKFDIYGGYMYQYGLSDIRNYKHNSNDKTSLESYMVSIGASYKFD